MGGCFLKGGTGIVKKDKWIGRHRQVDSDLGEVSSVNTHELSTFLNRDDRWFCKINMEKNEQ
jgi:hypothetical protein